MLLEEMEELFEKHNDEFLKFDRVKNKRNHREDLHAFLLLDELAPRKVDMVACAEHDEIFLQPDPEEVAGKITEEQVIELIRCGVRLSDGSFCMFV